ncbi:SLBB domain-containing protein [Qipengyuania sp.]|uniref:SLBB domain-containing protein n=1 Tax=Qipengyuania sp. TaxID=2004515 RepID=UPI0035C79130
MRIFARLALIFASLSLSLTGAVAQTAPNAQVPPAQTPSAAPAAFENGYVIGISDVLDVAMVGSEDFRGRVTVQQDGTIQLPYVGTLTAQDKTLLQLSREIAAALTEGGYYIDPAIQVTVAQITSRYVTVLGEVANPGLIPIDRAYRVSEIIARVGGLRATGAETFYLRHEGGDEIPLTIETIARGGDAADPIVNPGDKIFVPAAPTFYIYGQVNAPGTYPIQNKMSLRMALARGGGLTSLGSDRRITVVRDGVEVKKFSLSDPIQDSDVIVVGERFF